MRGRPTREWWRSFKALHGTDPVVVRGKSSKKAKAPCKTEAQEQIDAVVWLSKNNILFYHIPNGGYRDAREGAKFKRMGTKSGIPDLCIPLARKSYHGLYIELKREYGGSLSDAQKYWLAELKEQGYDCYVAKGADDLIKYVKFYLGETNE